MFGLFKSKKPFEPLNEEAGKYFEHNLLWLDHVFPEPPIEERRILVPTSADFPIQWDKSEQSGREALRIVAAHMQIALDEIELAFYDNPIKRIDMGSSVIFLEDSPDTPQAAGFYHHKNDKGKFEVSIDRALLEKPDILISTIAHELAHVKILGHLQLDENDEILTDLATVFFGFGIFNANTSFQFSKSSDRWGYSMLGYMSQEEWAYALALMAFVQNENEPEWVKYLNPTIRKDLDKCLEYMYANEANIFRLDDGEDTIEHNDSQSPH